MPRADWLNVSQTEFLIPPSREEQQAIGALFSKLDSLITLHQRESILRRAFPLISAEKPAAGEGFSFLRTVSLQTSVSALG
ncbi:MAG: hypothetical protein HFJ75_01435 [Eggerthellaceae bacterium]|nr:hypothetical protein [Eggerthellaceae bacterium]